MDLKLKNPEFWYSFHGQIPGLLDWDMGNEFFLPCTTDQCPLAEQNLAKYRLQVMETPKVPQERGSSPGKDRPNSEPKSVMKYIFFNTRQTQYTAYKISKNKPFS